jgi:hypothetical protein
MPGGLRRNPIPEDLLDLLQAGLMRRATPLGVASGTRDP